MNLSPFLLVRNPPSPLQPSVMRHPAPYTPAIVVYLCTVSRVQCTMYIVQGMYMYNPYLLSARIANTDKQIVFKYSSTIRSDVH